MRSLDHAEFMQHLGVLFGGWPAMMLTQERKDAYWRGLQSMNLSTFVRCVDAALGEHGAEKIPTVNNIWNIARELRKADVSVKRVQETEVKRTDFVMSACWIAWIKFSAFRPLADDICTRLEKIRDEKINEFKAIYAEDNSLTMKEIGDVCVKAWLREINSSKESS